MLRLGLINRSLLTTHSLAPGGRDILHKGFEVVACPARTAINVLSSHQECWSRHQSQQCWRSRSVMKFRNKQPSNVVSDRAASKNLDESNNNVGI